MQFIIITPEQRGLVDAYALQKFDEYMNDLKQKAHLDELTQADFNQYLSEEEIKACINLQGSIVEWVRRCSQPAGEISIGIYRYSMSPYYDFRDLSKLVTEVYNRKLKEEAERRARQKRIEEQEREREAERKAKQEALEAKRRAEQEERERLAQVKAEFTRAEEEFRQKLSKDELPLTYPLEQYHPDLWFNFEPPTDEEILTWLRPEANALIPQQLRKIASWPPTRLVTWRWLSKPKILIHAYYEKDGAPWLVFSFMVTILAKVIFYFKAGTYNYSGFTLKLKEERLGEVIISKQYGDVGELCVPISLLSFLITNDLEAQGIEVKAMYNGYTEYLVNRYKGEVTIHSDFRRFLQDICGENGLVKGLLAWGLIDDKIAKIIEAKINEPAQLRSQQKPSSLEDKVERRDTKKARAFQLFSEGKRPGDLKVKSLGIKPNTAYRYYQGWKKSHYTSRNPT